MFPEYRDLTLKLRDDDREFSLMNRAAVNCCSAQYYNPATLNNMVFLHKGVWKY